VVRTGDVFNAVAVTSTGASRWLNYLLTKVDGQCRVVTRDGSKGFQTF
jgi:hypothetical protein